MFETVPLSSRYAYVRVSSKSQEENSSLESQKQQFLKLGVPEENIRIEIASAVDNIADRPIFYKLIDQELQENDLLLVTRMDRCSRNVFEFLKLQEKLFNKKLNFICLDLPHSTDMAVNKLVTTILAAMATFENDRRRERQREGILVAKQNGKYLGRKTVITPKLIAEVRDLKENRKLSNTQIARLTGRGRTTIYRILKEQLNYVPYGKLVKHEDSKLVKRRKQMKPTKFSFDSQNLVIDYLSLKFEVFTDLEIQRLANYLLNLGFNSYKSSKSSHQPVQTILWNSENTAEARFLRLSYSRGTALNFTGQNAAVFYRCIQRNSIDWSFFSSGVLTRLDLKYFREHKPQDSISVQEFFQRCQEKLKLKTKNFTYSNNSKGQIFKIGSRKSDRYSRIYASRDGLHFEQEMKGKFIRPYYSLLLNHLLEEFEQALTQAFLTYFAENLVLEFLYTDWLLLSLRPIVRPKNNSLLFNGDYITQTIPKSLEEKEHVIALLQFLRYIKPLPYQSVFRLETPYRQVVFQLKDFLKFQAQNFNTYQLKKTSIFLNDLQKRLFLHYFTPTSFTGLVGIPKVRIYKENNLEKNPSMAEVCLAEDLFHYTFPFMLPDFFETKLNKDDFAVRFEICQIFTSVQIAKEFRIQEFLDNYFTKISNSRIAKIKQSFVQSVWLLEKFNLIESYYTNLNDGKSYPIQQLKSRNLGKGFIIYEKLSFKKLKQAPLKQD